MRLDPSDHAPRKLGTSFRITAPRGHATALLKRKTCLRPASMTCTHCKFCVELCHVDGSCESPKNKHSVQIQRPRVFLLLALLPVAVFAQNLSPGAAAMTSCSVNRTQPLYLPIFNQTLAGGATKRGIPVSVGTPPQQLAFSISSSLNYTAVNDNGLTCQPGANASEAECTTTRGGSFDRRASTSWVTSSLSALGLREEFPSVGVSTAGTTYGVDLLSLGGSTSLSSLPLESFKFWGMNSFGLGTNSTMLRGLVSTGDIASRSWSFTQGWTGTESQFQTNGSLVFGGYDRARVSGNNITLPFATNADDLKRCPTAMIVTIKDLQTKMKNGSSPSILGPNNDFPLRGCIVTDYTYISLQSDQWAAFVNKSGSVETGHSVSPESFTQNMIAADGAYVLKAVASSKLTYCSGILGICWSLLILDWILSYQITNSSKWKSVSMLKGESI